MKSRISLFFALTCCVQNAYSYPYNVRQPSGNSLLGYPNLLNYPQNSANALSQLPRTASLASANVGQNYGLGNGQQNFGLANTNLVNAGLTNLNGALGNVNLNNLGASKLNLNNLASGLLGNLGAGSLATSSASAQNLARNIVGGASKLGLNQGNLYSPGNHGLLLGGASLSRPSQGATLGGASLGVPSLGGASLGRSSLASYADSSSSAHAFAEEEPVDCPEGMEIIGYVTFEGYLPVQGSVNVADNMCDDSNCQG